MCVVGVGEGVRVCVSKCYMSCCVFYVASVCEDSCFYTERLILTSIKHLIPILLNQLSVFIVSTFHLGFIHCRVK